MNNKSNQDKQCGDTLWCPYHKKNVSMGNYAVMIESNIRPIERANNPHETMPLSPPNGGIYGGVQSTKPWANRPTPPTSANYITIELESANPPPGAMQQLNGTNRDKNNYNPMTGVSWYNPVGFEGQYNIMGI